MELISVEKLIEILKNKNINLGKGDPYNRLRYYTKIGWLPHMVRKKNDAGVISGHYPISVIDQIIKIEELKDKKADKHEITKILKGNQSNKYAYLENLKNQIKKLNINYFFIFLILLGFATEIIKFDSNYPSDKSSNLSVKDRIIPKKEITDSGVSFIPKNQNAIFVPSEKADPTAVILLNFFSDIGPNNRYFIKEIKIGQGFYVETSNQVLNETKFNWVIIQ